MKKRFKGLFFAFMFSIVVLLGLWVINVKLAIKSYIQIKVIEQQQTQIDSMKIQLDAMYLLKNNIDMETATQKNFNQ